MKDIEKEVCQFYKRLPGSSTSSLPVIQPQVMMDEYILDRATQLSLVKLVTVRGGISGSS